LEKLHDKGEENIETVIVKDYNEDNAYKEAINGVQGVIHVASDMTFSSNADEVIPPVLKAYKNILEAANSQQSIRRFVLTSSSSAAGLPNIEKGKPTQYFDASTWNEKAVEDHKKSPTGMNVYAASKTLSEKFAWDFIKDKKPHFTLTTILPNTNFGAPVPGLPTLTTGAWITDLADKGEAIVLNTGPQYHVDVGDVAKLHVIALTNENVKNEVRSLLCRWDSTLT
jgi:nucleoside-diphosphate-sugar epimerase